MPVAGGERWWLAPGNGEQSPQIRPKVARGTAGASRSVTQCLYEVGTVG